MKKSNKKVIGTCIILTLLFVSLCINYLFSTLNNTFAKSLDSVPTEENIGIISGNNVEGHAGEIVDITIKLENNPGISSLSYDIVYDSNVLTLIKVVDNKLLEEASFVTSEFLTNVPFRSIWMLGLYNCKANGDLITYTFQIKDDAKSGTYPVEIVYDSEDIFNSKFENVAFNTIAPEVVVVENIINTVVPTPDSTPVVTDSPIPTDTEAPTETAIAYELGDVDDNGKVDATDALLVLKHAAKLSKLDDIQKLSADVTKDDRIDATDALMILKYAARIINRF